MCQHEARTIIYTAETCKFLIVGQRLLIARSVQLASYVNGGLFEWYSLVDSIGVS